MRTYHGTAEHANPPSPGKLQGQSRIYTHRLHFFNSVSAEHHRCHPATRFISDDKPLKLFLFYRLCSGPTREHFSFALH